MDHVLKVKQRRLIFNGTRVSSIVYCSSVAAVHAGFDSLYGLMICPKVDNLAHLFSCKLPSFFVDAFGWRASLVHISNGCSCSAGTQALPPFETPRGNRLWDAGPDRPRPASRSRSRKNSECRPPRRTRRAREPLLPGASSANGRPDGVISPVLR